MPHGKLRDYGADLTLKKLPRPTVSADSCQQLYQRNGLWCVGLHRRRSGVLGAGVFSWLSLEPVILQRLRSSGELPTALRTSLGIQLAPALVACSARLSVNGGEGDTLAKMLFGYGLLQLLFMLRLMPWYLSQPFNASFWSFSFGVSALATTGLHLGSGSDNGFFIRWRCRCLSLPILLLQYCSSVLLRF